MQAKLPGFLFHVGAGTGGTYLGTVIETFTLPQLPETPSTVYRALTVMLDVPPLSPDEVPARVIVTTPLLLILAEKIELLADTCQLVELLLGTFVR